MQDGSDILVPMQEDGAASKVLKANDFEALANARQGIQQAQAEAASVVAAAHEEAEAIRAAARSEAESDRAALVTEYAARMTDQLSRTQEVLTGVVMTSLRRILDPVPKAEKVAGAVACALRETDIGGGAVLIVAPPLMHTLRDKFEERGIPSEMLEVRGDPDCPLESSILRSAFGDVELGIEFQLRALERGLREARDSRGER
jgi:flagellar biosynthesis/type III secretory pathway protein FliH